MRIFNIEIEMSLNDQTFCPIGATCRNNEKESRLLLERKWGKDIITK